MNQQQLEQQWVDGRLPLVVHRFGTVVRLDAQTTGRVVALLAVRPEPEYVIELPDGTSVVAPQSKVVRVG